PLWASFYTGLNGAALTKYATDSPHNNATSGNNTLTVTGFPVTDGATYAWNALASNGVVTSDAKYGRPATCYFRVDATSPTSTGVASVDFPAQGGGKVANQSGTFT